MENHQKNDYNNCPWHNRKSRSPERYSSPYTPVYGICACYYLLLQRSFMLLHCSRTEQRFNFTFHSLLMFFLFITLLNNSSEIFLGHFFNCFPLHFGFDKKIFPFEIFSRFSLYPVVQVFTLFYSNFQPFWGFHFCFQLKKTLLKNLY